MEIEKLTASVRELEKHLGLVLDDHYGMDRCDWDAAREALEGEG